MSHDHAIITKHSIDIDTLFEEVMGLIPDDMLSSKEYLNDVIHQAASNNFDGWLLMLQSFVRGLIASGHSKVNLLSGHPKLVTEFLLSDAPLRIEMFTKNNQGKNQVNNSHTKEI
jgi:hypothetical protein